jgi:hypothetical protein
VKDIEDDKICSPSLLTENVALPPILHYCSSRYLLGKHVFGKHRIPTDVFSCKKPLLVLPPQDLVKRYDYYIDPNDTGKEVKWEYQYEIKENAFMSCTLTMLVNEASDFFQSKNCEGSKDKSTAYDVWSKKAVKIE